MHFYMRFFGMMLLLAIAAVIAVQGVIMLASGTSLTILAIILIALGVAVLGSMATPATHLALGWKSRWRVQKLVDEHWHGTAVFSYFGRQVGVRLANRLPSEASVTTWFVMRGMDVYDVSRGSILADAEVGMLMPIKVEATSDLQAAA